MELSLTITAEDTHTNLKVDLPCCFHRVGEMSQYFANMLKTDL